MKKQFDTSEELEFTAKLLDKLQYSVLDYRTTIILRTHKAQEERQEQAAAAAALQ